MKTVAALESTHLRGPIRGQYLGHMIALDQSEARVHSEDWDEIFTTREEGIYIENILNLFPELEGDEQYEHIDKGQKTLETISSVFC